MRFPVLLTLGLVILVSGAQERCFCRLPNFLTGYWTSTYTFVSDNGKLISHSAQRKFGIDFRSAYIRTVNIGRYGEAQPQVYDYQRNISVTLIWAGCCYNQTLVRGWPEWTPEPCVPDNQIDGSPDDGPGIKTFFDDTRDPAKKRQITYKVDDNCNPTFISVNFTTVTDVSYDVKLFNFTVESNLSHDYFEQGLDECELANLG